MQTGRDSRAGSFLNSSQVITPGRAGASSSCWPGISGLVRAGAARSVGGRSSDASSGASCRTSCQRLAPIRERELDRGARARRPQRPPGGDHRAGRAQDDDQRAQFRAPRSSWRTSRTRSPRPGPTWWPGQLNCMDAVRRTLEYTSPEGKRYRSGRAARDAGGPAAGMAPRREARAGGRRARAGQPVRFRPLLLSQRPRAAGPRQRAVLLPAQAGEPPRGAALERGVRCWRRMRWACPEGPSGRRC